MLLDALFGAPTTVNAIFGIMPVGNTGGTQFPWLVAFLQYQSFLLVHSGTGFIRLLFIVITIYIIYYSLLYLTVAVHFSLLMSYVSVSITPSPASVISTSLGSTHSPSSRLNDTSEVRILAWLPVS